MKIYSQIGNILNNSAVIFVTHSLPQLYRICRRVNVITKGTMSSYDSVDEAVTFYSNQISRPKTKEKSSIIYNNPNIKELTYTYPDKHNENDALVITINFYSTMETTARELIINFTNTCGVLSAEGRISFSDLYDTKIKQGINKFVIQIDKLPLRTDYYYFDYELYCSTHKESIIHVSKAGPIYVKNKTPSDAILIFDMNIKPSNPT